MTEILVLIESSGKIKKIKPILENIFNNANITVMASFGHIMDLEKTSLSVDIKNNFEPKYITNPDKIDLVKKIKKAYNKSHTVYLASDADREGEMIAWSLANQLKIKKEQRITFISITKQEIEDAIKNPRKIDMDLVGAQKARRIIDRIVGYETSPILPDGCISAGRVQTIVVRIITDQETKIKNFIDNPISSSYKITGKFYDINKNLVDSVLDAEINKYETAKETIQSLSQSVYKLGKITDKESIQQPHPPFTTSTLQQEASTKLHMAAKKTMLVAQNLYVAGYITYMRTDSTNLSPECLKKIKKYIMEKYGADFYRQFIYKTKTANTQEAHEAIRPTDISTDKIEGNDDEKKLYDLIWKRTVASQMTPAIYNINTIEIIPDKVKYKFIASTKNIKNIGFLIIYNSEKDKINLVKLPDNPILNSLMAEQLYKTPPYRYDEAALIKKLEKLGIGRPATTASMINKVQERKYIEYSSNNGIKKESIIIEWKKSMTEKKIPVYLGKDKNKLVPTELGITVTEFLMKNVPIIMDYDFTAKMEEKLDNIAEGKINWAQVVGEFYKDFHPHIIGLVKVRQNGNIIGKHPVTGEDIIKYNGKYGPYITMGTKKASINAEDTMVEIIEKLKYPIDLGKYLDIDILIKKGAYGTYINYGDNNITIDNENIDAKTAIEYIKNRKKHKEFKDKDTIYRIINGKYGKYIQVYNSKKNVTVNHKVYKDIDDDISLSGIKKLIKI